MTFAKIVSTGSYLPEKILSNADLEEKVRTTNEWIIQRTGIRRRRIASKEETASAMGIAAASIALKSADLQPKDIEAVIVATCTHHQIFPSTACLIQEALDIPDCMAFDIQAACGGFLYALSIATQYLENHQVQRILIVGTETMSCVVDWQERSTCVLFGDGAGAVILENSETPGILNVQLSANGQYKNLLYLNNAKMSKDSYIRMEGNPIFRLAVKYLSEIAIKVIENSHLIPNDIDWIVPHQANIRIIKATAKKLGIPMGKVIVTIDEQANTSSASIPIALDVAIRDGDILRGQYLLLEAFGGGLTWGAALVRF